MSNITFPFSMTRVYDALDFGSNFGVSNVHLIHEYIL